MNCLIIQNAGLGDIIFCQKIMHDYLDKGYEIYWPVIPQYTWIKDYIKHPKVHWNKDYSIEYEVTLDLQQSTKYTPAGTYHMDSKYNYVGLTHNDWQNYFTFERNLEKENKLYEMVVGTAEKYDVISDTYASPPGSIRLNLNRFATANKTVFVRYIDGYTPFDWCKVFENAENITIVDTCFTWILEKLELKAKTKTLVSRLGCDSNETLRFFKQDWKVFPCQMH